MHFSWSLVLPIAQFVTTSRGHEVPDPTLPNYLSLELVRQVGGYSTIRKHTASVPGTMRNHLIVSPAPPDLEDSLVPTFE